MAYNDELVFEQDVIKKLTAHGWSKNILKYKTEEELIDNWAEILFNNNKGIDRLNGEPLTDGEKGQLLEQINKLKTPFNLNKFVNGKTIYIKRDNPNDKLHYGKEVALDIYDRNQIAGGKSVYQICEQPIFKCKDSVYPNRRGDLMLLINGMPLIHIELKRSKVSVTQAIEQIKKYSHEKVFTGLFSLVQVFVAMNPEESKYFANPGEDYLFNDSFYFEWADKNNEPYKVWDKTVEQLLSIPMAHKLIGFYTVPDKGDGVLKVMRSYQYYACEAINSRVERAEWTLKDRLGGYICHTTGSGKTMTSFKTAQLLSQAKRCDKVVFLIDRIELGTQSALEYKNYMDDKEDVQETEDTIALITKLKSDDTANNLIVTSIQKMSNIQLDEGVNARDIEKINKKRIVFIVDECHRSTFGLMLAGIKKTFPTALYFGFTGTPIYEENIKKDSTTTTVFGNELHRYSIADGIRDKNVLGFDPSMVLTFKDNEIRQEIALKEAKATSVADAFSSSSKTKKYMAFQKLPMVGHYETKDGETIYIKGIEDYIDKTQYMLDKGNPDLNIPPKKLETQHPYQVVKDILDNWQTLSVNGKFHAIFATSSIMEAIDYYHLFKEMMGKDGRPTLKITGVFDESIGNDKLAIPKEDALKEILADYKTNFGKEYNIGGYGDFKKDVSLRLAHKKTYLGIEKTHPELQLNLVIVVDQMLTGFDSKWVNTLYLDKKLKYQGLIQAFSRTNRIFGVGKDFGNIKWYRYPHTMQKNCEEAFELYSGTKPYGIFVEKLEGNLNRINAYFEIIKKVFDGCGIRNFQRNPDDVEDRAMFAKMFVQLVLTIDAAIIQGFIWEKQVYNFDHEGSDDTSVKVLLDNKTYKVLALRYKELFIRPTPPEPNDPDDNHDVPYDIDATAISVDVDNIDDNYLNSKFKKWLLSLYNEEEQGVVSKLQQQLHSEFASLSQEDQKFAEQILYDIQSGVLKIDKDDKMTFNDYINQYKINATNDQISRFSAKLGFDESILRDLMKSKNLDDGKFDEFSKKMNVSVAKAYFDSRDGKSYPKPLIVSMAENLARDFIKKGGFDL